MSIIGTKARSEQVEFLCIRLGFDGFLCVERSGLGGGLALFCRDKDVASLLSYSQNYIDMVVTLLDKPTYRLTCFYGFLERTRRQQSWDLLQNLRGQSSLPWVVLGDFNDLFCQFEKRGPHVHPNSLIQRFNDALQDCNLFDLGMLGNRFTWERGLGTNAWVEERLDTAVASMKWSELFDDVAVYNILTLTLDHSAIFLNLEATLRRPMRRKFRFEFPWPETKNHFLPWRRTNLFFF